MPKKKQSIAKEFEFTLPMGLIDSKGKLHRHGRMRLATAKDEIIVTQDYRVRDNPSYGVLVYLSQVITQLGGLSKLTPALLEELTILDLSYLRKFYNQINQHQTAMIPVECPYCTKEFQVELELAGES